MDPDDYTVLPAGDLLAIIERPSISGAYTDVTIARVLAIRVPHAEPGDTIDRELYIEHHGWVDHVTDLAAPADIDRLARYYLDTMSKRGTLGDCEGCEPWVDHDYLIGLYPDEE